MKNAFVENLLRNCTYQRAKGTERDNGYPEGEHKRDCDICQGADEIDRLIAEDHRLRTALQALLDRYVGLVNCGDCGHWDPEKEDEVIAARAALRGDT